MSIVGLEVNAVLLWIVGVLFYIGTGGAIAMLFSETFPHVEHVAKRLNLVEGFEYLSRIQIISIVLGWPLLVAAVVIALGLILVALGLLIAAIAIVLVGIIVIILAIIALIIAVLLIIIAFIVAVIGAIIGLILLALAVIVVILILLTPFMAFPTTRNFVRSYFKKGRTAKQEEPEIEDEE